MEKLKCKILSINFHRLIQRRTYWTQLIGQELDDTVDSNGISLKTSSGAEKMRQSTLLMNQELFELRNEKSALLQELEKLQVKWTMINKQLQNHKLAIANQSL